jgi:hypothetical protein
VRDEKARRAHNLPLFWIGVLPHGEAGRGRCDPNACSSGTDAKLVEFRGATHPAAGLRGTQSLEREIGCDNDGVVPAGYEENFYSGMLCILSGA